MSLLTLRGDCLHDSLKFESGQKCATFVWWAIYIYLYIYLGTFLSQNMMGVHGIPPLIQNPKSMGKYIFFFSSV